MGIWKEIRNEHTDENGVTFIDAYETDDENEEGKSIALIIKGDVYYKDYRAMTDDMAQKVIKEAIKNQTTPSWACSNCGSHNIQQRAWVNINTGELVDYVESSDAEDYYCPDCGGHHKPKEI